jgi:murein DD-endopeptidase MepM/ murein hydrolase activator NlpD
MGACPRCKTDVALHEGRPFVSASGAIELWHPSCWAVKDARGVEEVTVVVPEPRGGKRWLAASAAAAVACVVGAAHATSTRRTTTSIAAIHLDEHERVRPRAMGTAREQLPSLDQTFPVPVVDGQRLDELYPSLVDWIHPVTGAAELYPAQPSRHFGAVRVGIERAECGAGHCGVDLDGPRGRPVVAVADGTVVRVEHHELGLDGRSGRYVRIEHDDGTLTAYMHLDEIAEGLQVGDHVDGGQYIGTLGATAVFSCAPHLHFSLEIPNRSDEHGDNTNTRYVDPAPFLMRAHVVSVPDRRHGLKPAM